MAAVRRGEHPKGETSAFTSAECEVNVLLSVPRKLV
jgi:hypothetical protein